MLLFRYSALTFNGHRIHYDRSYVTGVEGYPGLVVHGPLIATLLLDLLRGSRRAPRCRVPVQGAASDLRSAIRFRFAAAAADGKSVHLWARDHEGSLAMDATAIIR